MCLRGVGLERESERERGSEIERECAKDREREAVACWA